MFLAAIHDTLLKGAQHPLAARYASVCERRGLRFRAGTDEQIAAELDSFCRDFRPSLEPLLATRATQTNEVGRCSAIRASLALLAARGAASVGLLDLGCSAGLNLLVDRYGYDVGGRRFGDPDARPVLALELKEGDPPFALPAIECRVGLDLSPLDAADPDDVAWLLACLWPDDLERFERLEAALTVAAEARDELELVRGDMVGDLARAASLAQRAEHLVVLNCWSAAYVDPARRRELADAVARLATQRPLTWVTMEHPVVARDLGVLPDAAPLRHPGTSVVCATSFSGGASRSELLAETHPHGLWLAWHAR